MLPTRFGQTFFKTMKSRCKSQTFLCQQDSDRFSEAITVMKLFPQIRQSKWRRKNKFIPIGNFASIPTADLYEELQELLSSNCACIRKLLK